jgi:hypothetical protein
MKEGDIDGDDDPPRLFDQSFSLMIVAKRPTSEAFPLIYSSSVGLWGLSIKAL